MERTNSSNRAFSCSTTPGGPVILKNQLCPSRRVHAASIRVSPLVISTAENVAFGAFNEEIAEGTAAPSSAGNPIWRLHRFTLSASLPPSPGNVTTEMSALSPFGPTALKLAKRIADAGASFQLSGFLNLICAEVPG